MTGTITAVSWNIEKGLTWEEAATWVRQQDPDILFQQEVQPGQLGPQCERLGMDGYLAVRRPGSRNDNAILLKRGGPLAFAEEYEQNWAPWHAPANIAVRLRDADGTLSPRQISCVSGHACYWSAEHRLTEAKWCSTLTKPGWLALHFWDWNSYRIGEGGSWEDYDDHAYVANRTYYERGRRHTDDRPDREMLAAGYVEMARHAAERLHQPGAMNASSGYRHHPGRPPKSNYCIDRGYLSAELAPALTGFAVCDSPRLRRLSDHLPLRAEFDAAELRTILQRTPAPGSPLADVRPSTCPSEQE
ncbi:hypothetical protein ABZ820_39755 [Streptomyces diacarni]|uniref:hypothetical protein n=1 Tax=Streptomyces diacarni TaxID=2800381 RepID=UPI0033CBA261